MENKKSFVLYTDLIHTVKQLPDDKAGLLFKHILSYVNDENPEAEDFIVKIAFEPIKQQLLRDLDKWKTNLDKKSEAGKLGNLKRWHPDLFEKLSDGKITFEEAERITHNRKESHTDPYLSQEVANIAVNVNDSVTVNVNANVISKRKAEFKNSLFEYLEKYGKDMLNEFFLYWTEKSPKGKKMRFEKEKVFDPARRLSTWFSRSQEKIKKEKSSGQKESGVNKAIDSIYENLGTFNYDKE